jgi:preprotein translocase subunit SecG
MSIAINILLVFEVLICLLLILLVLMQRPKNEGLGAAFGGGMTENLFGAQTTNVLQTMTRNLGIAFFAISAVLGWLTVRQVAGKSSVEKALLSSGAPPAATPAPATPAPGTTPLEGVATPPVKVPEAPTTEPGTDGEKKPATPPPGAESGKTSPTPEAPSPAPQPVPAPATGKSEPAPAPEPPKPAEPEKK